MQEILRLLHVGVRNRGQDVFRDLNFYVLAGEILGIIGMPKDSEFIMQRVLKGVMPIDSGRIIHSLDFDLLPNDRACQGIYDIISDNTLIGSFSVAENIFIFNVQKMSNPLINHRAIRKISQKMLDDLLPGQISATQKVNTLSRFERSIVSICKALHTQSNLLVFDSFIDRFSESERKQFQAIIGVLQKRNIAMIVLSNNIQIAQDLCDRITIIRSGSTIKSLERADFSRDNILSCFYDKYDRESIHESVIPIGAANCLLKAKNIQTSKNGQTMDLYAFQSEIIGVIDLEHSWASKVIDQIYNPDKKSQIEICTCNETVPNKHGRSYHSDISLLERLGQPEILLQNRSILENIVFPAYQKSCRIFGIVRNNFLKYEAHEAKALLNFENVHDQDVADTIEKRLFTSLARNEMHYKRILLLKNPTRWLEPHHAKIVHEYMRQYAARGNTIIFSSSDMSEIRQLSLRYYILDGEQVREEKTV